MEEFKALVFSGLSVYNKNIVGAKSLLKKTASFCLCAALFAMGFALSSCKRKVEVELAEYTPLSKSVEEFSAAAQWAYEIEADRLSKKIDSFEAVSKSVPLSPLVVAALEGGAPMAPVYPALDGFGSLDTSSMQGELLEIVKTFCLDMLEYSQSAADYEKYQAALKAQKKSAPSQAPSGEDSSAPEENVPQKDSSKIDAAFASESIFSLAMFLADSSAAGVLKSFVIGRPFVGEELIEVPVRWTGQKQILHTKLYPVQAGESWKIQQIEIYKSEANDGNVKTDGN